MSRVVFLIMIAGAASLTPLPPDGDPDDNHQARKKKPVNPSKSGCLSGSEGDVAARFRLGAYRNKIFVLREPIDGIEEEVAITSRTAEHLVRREVGVPDDDESSALIVGLPTGGHAQRKRAEGVRLRIIFHGLRELRLRETLRRSHQ